MNFVRRFVRHLIGVDKSDRQAHDIKNQMASDILRIQKQISDVNRFIENSTAYKVAKATGRIKR